MFWEIHCINQYEYFLVKYYPAQLLFVLKTVFSTEAILKQFLNKNCVKLSCHVKETQPKNLIT